ncbi:MAG: hypothetical protein NTX67_11770 [Burkholderiales bacterium]|nr:hypothetical protein [Burkholderiales bacterium]
MLPTLTLWPAAPLRFVVSAVCVPSEAFELPISSSQAGPAGPQPSTVKTWAAIATLGDQTLFRRDENLSDLLSLLRADCFENWLDLKHPTRRIPTALMLDPTEFLERELQCQAHWRPNDIAAECWLEAASQLQVPVAQLLMDFEVRLTSQGHWVAKYVACLQNLVQAYRAQLTALNFQLDVFTSSSQSEALYETWGLESEIIAHAFRLPYPGELAHRYFKLFKGSDLC